MICFLNIAWCSLRKTSNVYNTLPCYHQAKLEYHLFLQGWTHLWNHDVAAQWTLFASKNLQPWGWKHTKKKQSRNIKINGRWVVTHVWLYHLSICPPMIHFITSTVVKAAVCDRACVWFKKHRERLKACVFYQTSFLNVIFGKFCLWNFLDINFF